jgi:hypothetical protein
MRVMRSTVELISMYIIVELAGDALTAVNDPFDNDIADT